MTAPHENRRRPREQLSGRGARTRALLVSSARAVFAERGYFETKLSDITEAAGVSAGTLYTYFDNREQVLAAIMEEAYDESLRPVSARPATEGDPIARIRSGNRHYVESFQASADVQKIIQQAGIVDADVRELRRQRADALFQRNALTIRALQADGRVDPDLDPDTTARNLSLMVTRTCTYMYVEEHADKRYRNGAGATRLADELTDTWLRALGVA